MTDADRIDLARAAPFRLGPLLVEPGLRQVTTAGPGGTAETLEPRVMQVLVAFAGAGGGIVSRDELVRRCWDGRIVGDDAINRVIARLRKLAESRGAHGFRIETITKVGYRLVGAAAPAAAAPAPAAPATTWVQPPLPPRLARRRSSALCGRAAEQAVLADAWAAAQDGRGQVVLLGGEAGIGKTYLATDMAQAVHAAGATVLFGHCDEDVPVPYRPFADAFRHCVAHVPGHVLDRHARHHRGELARLVPELRDRVADLPPPRPAEAEAERLLLFEAATGLLAEVARHAPVVLVLDDLHWAGASDLLLLRHHVRAAAGLRLLVVGTYRDSDLTPGHPLTPLLADLRREDHVRRCPLGGIDAAGVLAVLTSRAGHALGADGERAAHALHRDTSGNPFFISELLRHFTETGAVGEQDGRWRYGGSLADGVPDGIREVIARRLGRLSPATAAVLGWAAIVGNEFPPDVVESVVAGADDAVLDALDEAVAAGLVAETPGERDRYSFRHALVRATLYDGIGGTRRRRMHRRVAEQFEALAGGDPDRFVDELASQWVAGAGPDDIAKAVGYARRAGAKAAAGLAYEAAAAHYARAIAVFAPTDRAGELLCCDLLLDLGGVQRSAGDMDFRATMARAAAIARRHGDAGRLGRAALGSGHPGGLQWSSGVDPALVALYREALAALEERPGPAAAGEDDDALRVRLMGQLAIELRFGPERAQGQALTARALELARGGGDPPTRARAISARIYAIDDPSTLAERLALTAELEAAAAALGHLELGCVAASQRFDALLAAGDGDGAEAALARCEAMAGELRVPFFALFPRLLRTMLALMRGAADAEQQVCDTFAAGNLIALPHAGAMFNSQMFDLRARQGRLAELAGPLRAMVAAFPARADLRAALALLLCETDAAAEARQVMDGLAAEGFAVPFDMNWALALHLLAEATAALGAGRAAAILYPRVLPFAGQVGMANSVRCDGSLAHDAGLLAACLGRWDEAEAHFAAALAMNERIGARVAAVATRRARAATLLARGGDGAQAAALIAAAEADAATLGLTAEAAKLARLRGASRR